MMEMFVSNLLVIMVLVLSVAAYLEFEPSGYWRNYKILSLIRGIGGCGLAFFGVVSMMSGYHVHYCLGTKSWNPDFQGSENGLMLLFVLVVVGIVIVSVRAFSHLSPEE
jgi:hypothetical protein